MKLSQQCAPTQVVHVSQGVDYLLEVADTAHSQSYQELKASVDGSRGAAHWNGLLSGELPTFHVLKVNIRCWEDEVINQFLIKKNGRKYLLVINKIRQFVGVFLMCDLFRVFLYDLP